MSLSMCRANTLQPRTLITEEEIGYSPGPQQEQWKERGFASSFILWWHIISPGDECSVSEPWLTCLALWWSEWGAEAARNATAKKDEAERFTGWTVILQLSGHSVGRDHLYVKELRGRLGMWCTVRMVFHFLNMLEHIHYLNWWRREGRFSPFKSCSKDG